MIPGKPRAAIHVDPLTRQLEVLRADGGEVDRDVLADRMDRQLDRLAGALGVVAVLGVTLGYLLSRRF